MSIGPYMGDFRFNQRLLKEKDQQRGKIEMAKKLLASGKLIIIRLIHALDISRSMLMIWQESK